MAKHRDFLTIKQIQKMSNEEFCKMVTAYDGKEVDSIKQIAFKAFNGEELKEFVEHCIKLKNNGALGDVSNTLICYKSGCNNERRKDKCFCDNHLID